MTMRSHRLSSAAEIDPESTEVYRLLGRTYHTQGKTDEAVDPPIVARSS